MKNIVISTAIGALLFIVISLFIGIRNKIKNKWFENINTMELFKLCNDTTEEIYNEICALISSDENILESNESLYLGAKPECFVFSYGLLLIAMSHYDENFIESARYEEFRERVLRRMVSSTSEKYASMDVDMASVETQLNKVKEKELQKVMLALEFHKEQSISNKAEPLALLINNISKSVSLKGIENFRSLAEISYSALRKVDVQIQSYR